MEEWIIDRDRAETVAGYIGNWADAPGQRRIICIDYFDTVITRTVAPEHTKIIASAALSQLLGGSFSGIDLYRIRQDLELSLTNRNAEETGELDFCLHDLGQRFWAAIKERNPGFSQLSRQEFAVALINIEVVVEKAVQVVCPEVLHVMQLLRKKDIPLILVSDFYLPQENFKDILRSLGIESLFSRIYISSSHGKSKGSGKIYAQIAEDFHCSPEQMLMIGDNAHADIRMAREFGVPTLHLKRPAQADVYASFLKERSQANNGLAAHLEKLPLHGHFSEMACSLWLFTHRLFQELRREGAKDVFFLSKEGEFLKDLFILYQNEVFGAEQIRSHYLLASRKATFLPSLRPLAEEDFLRLFAHYRDISIGDFLQSLNFGEDLINEVRLQLAFDCEERFFDLRHRPEFAALLDLPIFRRGYEEKRSEQRANFRTYLDSFGVNAARDGLNLVDVGWKGSIQDNIFHILDRQVAIHGYFIGSFHATERCGKNLKKGLLFDNYQQLSPFYAVYNNNRSLYEMMLGATHGSADCYVAAQQYNRETEHAHLAVSAVIKTDDGDLYVLVLDLSEERALYDDAIRPLQDRMRRIFSLLDQGYLCAECPEPDPEWFARRHARMVFMPRKEEVDFFAGLYHLENFGIFEYTNFQTGNRLTLRQRWRNLRNVLRDPAILETGIWPPIILRRLGLGFLQHLDGKRRYLREFGRKGKDGESVSL